jgi:signal transduction histidine kinase
MMRRMLSKPWLNTVYDLCIVVFVVFVTSFYGEGYDKLIGLSMAVALVFRRRRPTAVMAFVSALALAQYVLAESFPRPLAGSPTGYDVAVLIAMVAVVSHAEQMWKAYAAGGTMLLGNALAFRVLPLDTAPDFADRFLEFAAFAGVGAAVWLTAYVLRTRRVYVASLEERAATAERERDHLAQLAAAEERAEIARELHDVVAHSLAVMIVQADGASYSVHTDHDRAHEALTTIAATGRDALEDMRRIVDVLRGGKQAGADADRRRVGLAHLEPLVERARSAGLQVDLHVEGESHGLSAADELTLSALPRKG